MRSGSRTVKEGDSVTQGQTIGVMGETGQAYGQHLHFEMHKGGWNINKSNAVNPLDYLGKRWRCWYTATRRNWVRKVNILGRLWY